MNARVRGQPRRRRVVLNCGDVALDIDERVVRVGGRRIEPTYGEFELLRRLMEDPGRVFSRKELLAATPSDATLRAVDVQVVRLRKRLSPARRFVVETVLRVGYRCRELQ